MVLRRRVEEKEARRGMGWAGRRRLDALEAVQERVEAREAERRRGRWVCVGFGRRIGNGAIHDAAILRQLR